MKKRTKTKRKNLLYGGGNLANPQASGGMDIIEGASAGLGLLTTTMSNFSPQIPKVEANETPITASSNNQLMDEWDSWQPIKHVTKKDFGADGKSTAMGAIGSTATGAMQGATLGSVIPGIGTVIGGVAGGLIGGISSIFGSNKKKRAVKRANRKIDDANNRTMLNFGNQADNIDTQNALGSMANFSAYGGQLGETQIPIGFSSPHTGSAIAYEAMMSQPNLKAFGGDTNGVTMFNNGGTHEQNMFGGIPQGVDNEGVPNLVEEGEVKYNDYIFSNRLKPTKLQLKELGMKNNKGTFADIAKKINKESEERPHDFISKNGLDSNMDKLKNIQELMRQDIDTNSFEDGGQKETKKKETKKKGNKSNIFTTQNLRYAPVLGSAIGVANDLFGKGFQPDYTAADTISGLNVTPETLSNYLAYNPFDRQYYLNQLNAQSGATRRGMINTSGGNRGNAMAGLLAADQNYLNSIGILGRQAEEYNQSQRERVEQFNRGTNMFNADAIMKAQLANNDYKARGSIIRSDLTNQARLQKQQSMSANLTNLFDNIGGIGREDYAREMINSNPALLYGINNQGTVGYRKANGGKLKKRKGGLSYGI